MPRSQPLSVLREVKREALEWGDMIQRKRVCRKQERRQTEELT